MQNLIPKIKKIGIYILAAIGTLSILLVAFQFVLLSLRGASSYSQQGGGRFLSLKPSSSSGLNLLGMEELGLIDSKETGTGNAGGTGVATEGQLTQRKIIKNGSLSVLVKGAEETVSSIQNLATRLNGFVSSSEVYEVSEGLKAGTVIIRVPAEHFDEAITEIKKLALRVESENVNVSDVTEQFTDLEAQLKNLRAEEEQYLKVMEIASTVEDILKVSQKLSDVRGRIERIQGQLQYLSRQIDMSSITVLITSEAEVKVLGIYWRPLSVLRQSLRNMLRGLSGYIDAMIRLVFSLPVILLWAATVVFLIVFVWKILRRIWKRFLVS